MLNEILISEVRVNILKKMLPNPEKSYHVRALVRAVDTEINAVRRELKRLSEAGLLRKRSSGNRVYYNVNTDSPLYPELVSLIAKEEGLGAQIIKASKELGNVKFAVLSRGFSRGRAPSVLNVDIFIVGSVNMPVLDQIIKNEEALTGREINYSVMGNEEFEFRKRKNDQFVMKILAQSRTMLIGDEEDFCEI